LDEVTIGNRYAERRKRRLMMLMGILVRLNTAAVTDDDLAVLDDVANGIPAELVDEKRKAGYVA
jgi:hypothetical protein